MGRSISLFADYKGENAITNYCGLILKLLYRESPSSFEEVVAGLVPDSHPVSVGPSFLQQTKKQKSIPDLLIQQRAFNIWFETKLDDWFYSQQLEEHIKGLSANAGTNVLIALSNFEGSDLESRFAADIQKAAAVNVHFRALSFEEFVEALERVPSSQSFKEMLAEFVEYLDREGHLPKWKHLLEVVNCAATIPEVQVHGVYICPATGGAYAHRRARYLGTYGNKTVPSIHEVRGAVVVDKGGTSATCIHRKAGETATKLEADAITKALLLRPTDIATAPMQVILVDQGFATNFRKDSSGGLFQSKKYFWDIAKKVGAKDANELADKLRDRNWSEFE
jgi:hypothetical protein